MPPSIDELTITLYKGDEFKLHPQGAEKMKEKYDRIEFEGGDVLRYSGDKIIDFPSLTKGQSVWMENGKLKFKVPVNEDLFSGKVS